MKRILVIEAHSDDSAIGASGYIRHLLKEGHLVYFLLVASGDVNFIHQKKVIDSSTRLEEYCDYIENLGKDLPGITHMYVNSTGKFCITDKESVLDTVPMIELVTPIEAYIKEVNPQIIIGQGPSFHQDHKRVYEAIMAALRPTQRYLALEQVLFMENPTYVHGETLTPNFYYGMTEEQIDTKLNIFKSCFPSQVRPDDNCLSTYGIKQWAKYRALEMGYPHLYAEAFHIHKHVII